MNDTVGPESQPPSPSIGVLVVKIRQSVAGKSWIGELKMLVQMRLLPLLVSVFVTPG